MTGTPPIYGQSILVEILLLGSEAFSFTQAVHILLPSAGVSLPAMMIGVLAMRTVTSYPPTTEDGPTLDRLAVRRILRVLVLLSLEGLYVGGRALGLFQLQDETEIWQGRKIGDDMGLLDDMAGKGSEYHMTLPWRPSRPDGDGIVVIRDGLEQEICRVNSRLPNAKEHTRMICAIGWLLVACKQGAEAILPYTGISNDVKGMLLKALEEALGPSRGGLSV